MRAASIDARGRLIESAPAARTFAPVWIRTVALAGIVCLAAGLRLASLRSVPNNLLYDAAVRSMSQSWHNFFYAAFEPGGRVAIDKPPIDLWLQVASVKLLGFNSFALKLPEALAGTAAVPLIYALVRRLFGTGAGLASALALAVLPITVLTSRSDTMDTLMMTLILVAAWLVVRAVETDRSRYLFAAAAVMGIDFNVKLFEALLPVPALAVLYLLGARTDLARRLRRAGVAALVFVTVALSWPLAVSLSPSHHKPYPLGSNDGSVWNSIFVFDGLDRVSKPARARHVPGRHDPPPPAATRLFAAGATALDQEVGSELLPAILFGVLAFALVAGSAARERRATGRWPRAPAVAGAVAIALWLVIGAVSFSAMTRLHSRYLEAFSPAVAAALGVGVVVLAKASTKQRWARVSLLSSLGLCTAYAAHLAGHQPGLRTFILCTAILAASLCLVAWIVDLSPLRALGGRALAVGTSVLVLVPLLAVPASQSLAIVRHAASDSTTVLARQDPHRLARLRAFLLAHQGRARYEVATRNPWQAAPLIVADGRPLLIVRNVNGHALVSLKELGAKVRVRQLSYVWLGGRCSQSQAGHFTSCQPLAGWVRRHGTRVRQVGNPQGLWRVRVP